MVGRLESELMVGKKKAHNRKRINNKKESATARRKKEGKKVFGCECTWVGLWIAGMLHVVSTVKVSAQRAQDVASQMEAYTT